MLQRSIGNRALQNDSNSVAHNSNKTGISREAVSPDIKNPGVGIIQGKWRFIPDTKRLDRNNDKYYWDTRYHTPEPVLAPGIARRLRLEKLDARAGSDHDMIEEQYTLYTGSSSSGSSRSNKYNPFGRFNDNITMSAYIPRDGATMDFSKIVDEDSSIISWGGDTGTSAPAYVVTKESDPQKLNLIAADPYGLTYGDGPLLHINAFPTAQKIRVPNGLPPKLKFNPDELMHASVEANRIDNSVISGFKGGRQDEDGQIKIMGVSAAEMARAAGYDNAVDPEFEHDKSPTGTKKHGWEWLHLISYALGGPTQLGPQTAENLVVGTTAANTTMIMFEDAINSLITEKVIKAAMINVLAIMADEQYRVAGQIVYSIRILLNDDREVPLDPIHFSALTKSTPFVVTNKYIRAMLRAKLKGITTSVPDNTKYDFYS
ncbi:hypothetical protein [Chitinophaga silvisoli]|uniref:Uncharacterized protein n=1 Tax=Chitinophaga silvisoli TaxID=2291814 RepID=A0A3E1P796_9BACT|nr:hypothetical protein [Chitinophaga silvisoli]RFM36041.1 hypothetical protein DXN04_00560 [Chitinophaga silvisoli]